MAQLIHPKKYAYFTPSVSQMYVLAHAKKWPRQPVDFDLLNFMDDANKDHFTWPANLYSAGHAHLDPQKSDAKEVMIQARNRTNSVLIGDSGGFQAATGVLEFDWDNPLGEKAQEQRIELLRWLEHTADYSMVLDWPAWAIPTGRLPSQLKAKNPATGEATNDKDEDQTFENCLAGTVWNNHFFVKHRQVNEDGTTPTKFLNVLQGRTFEQAVEWYNRVTPFSDTKIHGNRAFEGWALGGATGGDPSMTMKLLVMLRRDGLLSGPDRWIHVLGRSRLSTAVYLAALNESLSRNLNPGIQISYDASSAFLYAVNGNYVTDFACSPKGMNLISTDWPKHPKYIRQSDKTIEYMAKLKEKMGRKFNFAEIMEDAGSQPFIYNGVSADRLSGKDMEVVDNGIYKTKPLVPPHYKSPLSQLPQMTMDQFILAQDLEKVGESGFCMDTASYYYIMAHNVQMQANAVEWVCDKMFAEDAVDFIPTIFLEFKRDVDELFRTHKPWDELTQAEQDDYTAKSLAMCDSHFTLQKYGDLISGERMGFSTQGVFDYVPSDAAALEQENIDRKAKSSKAGKKKPKPPQPVGWNEIYDNPGVVSVLSDSSQSKGSV